MEILTETPSAGNSRGLSGLVRQFFGWRHLLIVGATCCVALSLFFYLYIAAVRLAVVCLLCPLSLVLFAIMLTKGGLLRYPDMKLLLAAFVWLLVVYIANAGRTDFAACVPYFAHSCAIPLLCYPLAYAVKQARRLKTFDLLAWLWIIPIVCSTVIAYVLVFTNTVLYRQSDMAPAGIVGGRLYLICDPNMYGMLCCLALCLILYLLLGKRKPVVKALLILFAVDMFVMLALTDSRTSQLSLLPTAFFFAAILIWQLLKNKKRALRLLAGALAGLVLCAALLLGYRGAQIGVNRLLAQISIARSSAAEKTPETAPTKPIIAAPVRPLVAAPAEPATVAPAPSPTAEPNPTDPPPATIRPRGFAAMESVNARFGVWTYAFGQLANAKDTLLRGTTPVLSHDLFMDRSDPATSLNHFHNAYLGVLISYGLPGLLLMLAFLIYLAVCACRLLFSRRSDLPVAIRFLPTILLAILSISFFEEMLFSYGFVSEMDVWLALIGGYTVTLAREWSPKTPQPAPEAPSPQAAP